MMHGAHHVIEHWGLPGRLLSEYMDALSPRRRLLCRGGVSRKPDWRSPRFAEALSRLDRAGFAREFLRRNPDYRADYNRVVREGQEALQLRRLANAGASAFACDPNVSAPWARAIWRPELDEHNARYYETTPISRPTVADRFSKPIAKPK